MPIVPADIDYFLSGGNANADPDASLGGVISGATQVVNAVVNNLFDRVTGAESQAGDVEYRCIYIRNSHGSLALQSAAVFIETNTVSAETAVDIGLGTSAVNAVEQTVADEATAPAGVTFVPANGAGNALAIGDIPAGQHKAIWLRWTVNAAAAAVAADTAVIRTQGDTAA